MSRNGALLDELAMRAVDLPVRDRDGLVAPVVVGCSGGADSTLLLALVAHVGLLPVAVHVDHGLRPGSAADADVVRAHAERVGARFRSTSVRIEPGSNLEARARDARRIALDGVARSVGAHAVVLGHTMDDQAETVLLALLRGAGATGLGAMAPVSVRPDGPPLHRPLLGLRRSETRAGCAALGFDVLDDPMNEDLSLRRVWIRREVLPELSEGARRDLVPVLARQAELLRSESAYLDELGEAAWPGGHARAADLAALDPVVARRAVRRWIGTPPPRFDEVETILAVARCERRAVELAGGRRVWRRGGVMYHGAHAAARGYVVGA